MIQSLGKPMTIAMIASIVVSLATVIFAVFISYSQFMISTERQAESLKTLKDAFLLTLAEQAEFREMTRTKPAARKSRAQSAEKSRR